MYDDDDDDDMDATRTTTIASDRDRSRELAKNICGAPSSIKSSWVEGEHGKDV